MRTTGVRDNLLLNMSFAVRPKNTEKRLTKRQQQLLDFIREFMQAHKFPPSIREMAAGVGLSSSSTVHSHVGSLERKGFIRRDHNHPRSIVLIEPEAQADVALLAALASWSERYGAAAPAMAAKVQAFSNILQREVA